MNVSSIIIMWVFLDFFSPLISSTLTSPVSFELILPTSFPFFSLSYVSIAFEINPNQCLLELYGSIKTTILIATLLDRIAKTKYMNKRFFSKT